MTTWTRPPTAQEAVLLELRRLIATGTLRPGEQVVQESLAARLGVSRVPIREALKMLEGEGQVVYSPHRGYFVASLSLDDLLEVYRIRRLLEDEAVRVACGRLDPTALVALRATQERVHAAGQAADVAAMAAANRDLHFAVFEASGLPRLVRMIRQLWDATDVYRSVYYADPHHRSRVDAEHAAVLDALAAGDAPAAVRLLRAHREHAVNALRRLLDGAGLGA